MHTQKRKLQRLRNKEKKQREVEKVRDKNFNRYRPMVPQGKAWQIKTTDQPAELVRPTQPASQTASLDRSDCPKQPVRPVQSSVEPTTESAASVLVPCDEAPPFPSIQEDEELVDYEASLEHSNMEINIVHLSSDYFVVPEEEVAHLQFGPRDAVF